MAGMAVTPREAAEETKQKEKEEELKEAERKLENCDYVRFTTHDLNGIPRGMVLNRRRAFNYFRTGLPMYCGTNAMGPDETIIFPPEVVAKNLGNGLLKPDPSSFHYTPWFGDDRYTTGEVFGEVMWDESTAQVASCRYAARKQLERLTDVGFDLLSGAEWEFVLSEKATGKHLFPKKYYGTTLLYAEHDSWFIDIDQAMTRAGVQINAMHTEAGEGQLEFNLVPEYGIKGIDSIAILKQGIKEIAIKRGWNASFMAKNKGCSSGCHFSFSIWDRKTNTNGFYDESSPDGLSQIARYWVAGIVKHATALCALCCPTTNCYHRLHGPWTPHLANWGIEDRNSMLRVKNEGPKGTYMENRLPSALANPYLITAATIAAGLDGIRRKIPCPDPSDIETALVLPRNLEDTLDALQQDEAMVEALGQELVDWFVSLKMETSIKPLAELSDEQDRFNKEVDLHLAMC